MKPASALLLFVMFSASIMAQQNNISKEKYHWGTIEQDTAYGYAGVVKTGNTLYLSGVTSAGDFAEQVRNIYSTIGNMLKKYGATFQNVVKENLYTTNIDSMKHYAVIRKEFYKNDYPAATWVQVSGLFTPDHKLEVEVIAQLPEKPVLPEWPGNMILGTWGMNTKKGVIYETWQKKGNDHYSGVSYMVSGTDTSWLEYVDLKKTKEGVFYIVKTAGQNNEKPVSFKQTAARGNMFVFENPQHDFPKRIVYELVNEETIRAWIDDGPNNPKKRSTFNYKRIK